MTLHQDLREMERARFVRSPHPTAVERPRIESEANSLNYAKRAIGDRAINAVSASRYRGSR